MRRSPLFWCSRDFGDRNDAEGVEAIDDLAGDHRAPVVGHQRPWQPHPVEGLGQAVDEDMGRFLQVPLGVKDHAAMVIDRHPELWCDHLAAAGCDPDMLAVMYIARGHLRRGPRSS